MAIDWTKPVRTVKGHWPMTVLTTTRPERGAEVVAMNDRNGALSLYGLGGKRADALDPKIENVPEKHVAWLNLYRMKGFSALHPTKEAADSLAGPERIACLRIEYETGEGL